MFNLTLHVLNLTSHKIIFCILNGKNSEIPGEGACVPGGVRARGCMLGGMCGWGCACLGDMRAHGVHAWGVCIPHMPPLLTEFLTHACENITFLQLHWVPLRTSNLIHKSVFVINGTHCNQTF